MFRATRILINKPYRLSAGRFTFDFVGYDLLATNTIDRRNLSA